MARPDIENASRIGGVFHQFNLADGRVVTLHYDGFQASGFWSRPLPWRNTGILFWLLFLELGGQGI